MKHPDYPDIDFKPAIARYDWDQTYDVLEFVHLPQGFGIIANIPCSDLMAVDRFTPYSYLWAENYSDYLYDFCKAFNFSPHNSIGGGVLTDEHNNPILDYSRHNLWKGIWESGTSYMFEDVVTVNNEYYQCKTGNSDDGFTSENWIYEGKLDETKFQKLSFQGKIYLSLVDNTNLVPPVNAQGQTATSQWLELTTTIDPFEYMGNKYDVDAVYNVTFPKGEYQITMLIDCLNQDGLNGSIRTLNQVSYAINITEDKVTNGDNVYDLNKIIRWFTVDNVTATKYGDVSFEFCANSIVISKKTALGAWQEYTVSGLPVHLLYKDIATHFNDVKTELIAYFSGISGTAYNVDESVGYQNYEIGSYRDTPENRYAYIAVYNTIKPLPFLPPLQHYLESIKTNVDVALEPYTEKQWMKTDYNYVYTIEETTGYGIGSFNGSLVLNIGAESTFEEILEVTYRRFPSYLTDKCYLCRANNNKWELPNSSTSDLGTVPDYITLDGRSNDAIWAELNPVIEVDDDNIGEEIQGLFSIIPNVTLTYSDTFQTPSSPILLFGSNGITDKTVTVVADDFGRLIDRNALSIFGGYTYKTNDLSWNQYTKEYTIETLKASRAIRYNDSVVFTDKTETYVDRHEVLIWKQLSTYRNKPNVYTPVRTDYTLEEVNSTTYTYTYSFETIGQHEGVSNNDDFLIRATVPISSASSITFNENLFKTRVIFSQGEFEQIEQVRKTNGYSDADALTYLQGLKLQYEEDSKTW